MSTVKQIAQEIVAREGGFVNDPDDPGGATQYGVTQATLARLGLDLDRDGDVDVSDVRQLTRSQAVDIFIESYFYKAMLDRLPEVLQPSVFDMNVNAGSYGLRILQQVLSLFECAVTVDGVIGPKTQAAAHLAFRKAPHHLADAYAIARRNYYYALADKRPQSRKYARKRDGGKGGWITRAEHFMSPKYHFTANQHLERTRAWG